MIIIAISKTKTIKPGFHKSQFMGNLSVEDFLGKLSSYKIKATMLGM